MSGTNNNGGRVRSIELLYSIVYDNSTVRSLQPYSRVGQLHYFLLCAPTVSLFSELEQLFICWDHTWIDLPKFDNLESL